MIQLYDLATKYPNIRFSPFCWRIKYALAHKELSWEEIPIRALTEKNLLPTPNEGKVPVLVDDDQVVFDSWDIALYLEEKYPNQLLFDSSESRAQSLFVKNWTEAVLHILVSRMGILDFYETQTKDDQKVFRETRESRFGVVLEDWGSDPQGARVDFLKALEPLRQTLRSQKFMGGRTPNFSDYIMVGIFQWMRCGSRLKVFEESDNVFDYQERLLDLYDGLGRSSPPYSSIT
jgi:glutathione S-transferase